MTQHTDQEFEIVRKASRLFQEACETWMDRALKAETQLREITLSDKEISLLLRCLNMYPTKEYVRAVLAWLQIVNEGRQPR